jgi:hypothetical protein
MLVWRHFRCHCSNKVCTADHCQQLSGGMEGCVVTLVMVVTILVDDPLCTNYQPLRLTCFYRDVTIPSECLGKTQQSPSCYLILSMLFGVCSVWQLTQIAWCYNLYLCNIVAVGNNSYNTPTTTWTDII